MGICASAWNRNACASCSPEHTSAFTSEAAFAHQLVQLVRDIPRAFAVRCTLQLSSSGASTSSAAVRFACARSGVDADAATPSSRVAARNGRHGRPLVSANAPST
jgi:hypothetical protein